VSAETRARILAVALATLLPLGSLAARWLWRGGAQAIELQAWTPESGGWAPADLVVPAGEPLRLRLTSGDVVHGFAIGQSAAPAVDVLPGQVTEVELNFDRPGKYTFYCTRWCGPNHWRMRGTIEVLGEAPAGLPAEPPYVALGLDLDAPHPAASVPAARPSAERGAALDVDLPSAYFTTTYYQRTSPAAAWAGLRADPATAGLADEAVWDLAAYVWQASLAPGATAEGRELYAASCAACHGLDGRGGGVLAPTPAAHAAAAGEPHSATPDFADPGAMFGASPALLHGKIVRGGMGTGMPYWGPIFTDAQTWALVGYLWTFTMEVER
jgi:mono/diheme cytochrome c family protein